MSLVICPSGQFICNTNPENATTYQIDNVSFAPEMYLDLVNARSLPKTHQNTAPSSEKPVADTNVQPFFLIALGPINIINKNTNNNTNDGKDIAILDKKSLLLTPNNTNALLEHLDVPNLEDCIKTNNNCSANVKIIKQIHSNVSLNRHKREENIETNTNLEEFNNTSENAVIEGYVRPKRFVEEAEEAIKGLDNNKIDAITEGKEHFKIGTEIKEIIMNNATESKELNVNILYPQNNVNAIATDLDSTVKVSHAKESQFGETINSIIANTRSFYLGRKQAQTEDMNNRNETDIDDLAEVVTSELMIDYCFHPEYVVFTWIMCLVALTTTLRLYYLVKTFLAVILVTVFSLLITVAFPVLFSEPEQTAM